MMRFFRQGIDTLRKRPEQGITVIEMTIALVVTAVISAIMISWVVAVLRTDAFQTEDLDALDQMRTAKSRLVKELRFATAIDPDSSGSAITFAIELGGDEGPDLSGEIVTWEIQNDGDLIRFIDRDDTTFSIQATSLVPTSSGFTYDPGASMSPITIELVADVTIGSGPDARSIRTQVHARNA